jgi:hypothetical protein
LTASKALEVHRPGREDKGRTQPAECRNVQRTWERVQTTVWI